MEVDVYNFIKANVVEISGNAEILFSSDEIYIGYELSFQ